MYNVNIHQITDNNVNDYDAQVSAFGDIVWEHEFASDDIDLYYYSEGDNRIIAEDTVNEGYADISHLGVVIPM